MTVLIPTQSIALTRATPRFASQPFPIPRRLSEILVRLRRPTTVLPLTWEATGQVRVSLICTLDGVAHRATGQASGGIRLHPDGSEVPEYSLSFTPTSGFFGDRSRLRQLGERSQGPYTAHVELDRLAGSIMTEMTVEFSEAVDI
jgi:hypothetical protein